MLGAACSCLALALPNWLKHTNTGTACRTANGRCPTHNAAMERALCTNWLAKSYINFTVLFAGKKSHVDYYEHDSPYHYMWFIYFGYDEETPSNSHLYKHCCEHPAGKSPNQSLYID